MPRFTPYALLAIAALSVRTAAAQTDTSTSGIQFPEDTGVLPRAKMPEGGADRPFDKKAGKKTKGKTDKEPQAQPQTPAEPLVATEHGPFTGEHVHPHDHGGKVHSHLHRHNNDASHDHLHEGLDSDQPAEEHEHPHLHEHEHSHRHGTVEHAHPHRHEHEHDHSDTTGHQHSHLHGEEADHEHPHEPGDEPKSKLVFSWDGYLKIIAEVVENDPISAFIGRNDGFRVGNARLGTKVSYGDSLYAYISLEASVPRADDFNQPNAELTVGPRDLFIHYAVSRHAGITVGRFKAPYDIGELENEGDRVFIDVPLESRGVAPTQGFEVEGLRQGRQMGVMIHKPRVGLNPEGMDVGYAVGLTNGKTENFALNDNDKPAGYLRFSLFYANWLTVNVGGFTETRTTGDQPDLFDEEVLGGEGSLVLRLGDLRLEGQILYQRLTFPTAGTPRVNAFGVHGQWSYRMYGIEAAYRFAYYDPNNRVDVDAVNEHTLGLSYYVGELPLRFSLNATLAQEQRGREIENNRLALLAQYNF